MTSPQPPAHRPRKDGRWPLQRPTLPLMPSLTVRWNYTYSDLKKVCMRSIDSGAPASRLQSPVNDLPNLFAVQCTVFMRGR